MDRYHGWLIHIKIVSYHLLRDNRHHGHYRGVSCILFQDFSQLKM